MTKTGLKNTRRFRLNVRSELLFMLAINGVLIGNVKASVILALVFFAGLLLALLRRYNTAFRYVCSYCVPKSFSIPFAVILCFFPSVKEEWRSIIAAMKLRGIGLNVGNVLTHPIQTIEYLLVPLLSSLLF